MSWPPPTASPWNPGIPPPMNVPVPTMNMGAYTPQQWTAMQQNWGQWAQWQQQYSQWQGQYGNEYAQQVQAFQQMGLPPPPTQMAPPQPPPPEKPPPPPHENNQPLFGNMQPQVSLLPTPVQTPLQSQQNKQNYNNTIVPTGTGNNQNLSKLPEKRPEGQHKINEGALKKLAEEEKLFDIQFKKWEEQIEKWRVDNANHPDKEAYKNYEEKFESCRAELLERRKRMKQKRDALLGIPQQENKTTTASTSTLTPTQNTSSNYNNNTQLNNYKNNHTSEQASQFNNYDRASFSANDNKNVDPQDRYECYHNVNDNYTHAPSSDNANFLEKKTAGIPGLDLLPNIDKASKKYAEVIDISDDQQNNEQQSLEIIRQQTESRRGPDYTTISKGIDNILGDEKIMNILTMVKGQSSASGQDSPDNRNNNMNYNIDCPGQSMNPHNQPQYNQWNRNNDYNNQQYGGNKQNMQGGRPDYPMQQDQQSTFMNQQRRINDNGPGNMPLDNMNPKNVSMGRQQPQSLLSQNIHPNLRRMNEGGPGNVPLDNMDPKNVSMGRQQPQPQPLIAQNIHPNLRRMNEGGPGNMQQENRNPQNAGRQQIPPLMSQNIAPPRPFQQSAPQDYEHFNKGPPNDSKILGESNIPNIPLTSPQPQKPKWVDEAMFTPYIIVEYDHKPLRLKARDFIEPVHVFDYNHKSKEEDTKKKDFEEEVDKLFSRLPRKEKIDDDRYGREPPRDYAREDYHPRGNSRSEYGDRRRPDRYDDRRRDERDRNRSEHPLREREYNRGERELPRERERDFPRDRESMRDRERGSIRDRGREREFSRDRERDFTRDRERDSARDRERDSARDRERGFTRDRDRDSGRDKEKGSVKDSRDRFGRDMKRDERERSAWSQDNDFRKRGLSKESDLSDHSSSKRSRVNAANTPGQVPHIMIDDLLEPPGRDMRPEKIAIILRGPPGSGKSYLAKLIRDREAEFNGTARIMSIDDYFMHESTVEEKDPLTGKITTKPLLKYEYDINMEESYMASLRKSFKRSLANGYFTFLIFDAVNDQLRHYADIWNTARQHGFQVYVCTMELDPHVCHKRNIHNRTLEDIQVICCRFFKTPAHHLQLDPTTLLQNAAIQNVDMEDAVMEEDADDDVTNVKDVAAEVENTFTSKWEKMDDVDKLARLDGTSKPLRPSQLSMEDYLQLNDWKPSVAQPGKKTVRWADIEETREQEKMRAIGFVVGQTDWNRMTDPTMGSSALTQTKYIERVRRH